jgi:hypothetical protein
VVAVLVGTLGAGGALAAKSTKRPAATPSFYTLKNKRQKCRVHYTRQTISISVRKHHRTIRYQQVRCVYTGSRSSNGAAPSFPTNLPTAAISVTVIPAANDSNFSISAEQTLNVAGDGVLAGNAGSDLIVTLVSATMHGKLTLNRNGTFRYVPASGFSGVDEFTYKTTNSSGESSTPATVTIHVLPVAAAVAAYTLPASGTISVDPPGVLLGDTGSGLTAKLVSGPNSGTLTLNGDGSFSYTATPSFYGSDSFTYEAVDSSGQASSPVSVTIDVGVQPPSVVGETFSGAVGNTALQVGGSRGGGPEVYQGSSNALAGDSDPDGGTLSTTAATITTAQGGTVTLAVDGSFTYEPPVGLDSTDSFSYQVDTSEGASAQAIATIDFTARVWYVNSSATLNGNGGAESPFNSLASAVLAAGSGDVIFLFGGSYTGGVTLGANQTLVGQSAGLTVDSEDLLDPSGASDPVITAASGPVVTLGEADTLSGVSVVGTGSATAVSATVNDFTLDSDVSITAAGGDALDIEGGDGGLATVAAPITASGGHSVAIHNRTGGTVALSGPITDTGAGVAVQGDTGATINFSGTIYADTGASAAFTATGGGTVTATKPNSTLVTTTARALDVEGGSLIGPAGLTFESISAGNTGLHPSEGIVIADTGTAGGLSVLGDGNTQNSGGTIDGATGSAGVSLSNTGAVSLNDMDVTASVGDGIDASVAASLTVTYSQILASGGDGILEDGAATRQAQSFDLSNDTLTGGHGTAISLSYAGGAAGSIDYDDIGTSGTPGSGSATGDGIDLTSDGGSASVGADISDNHLYGIASGTGILITTPGVIATPGGGALQLTLESNVVAMGSGSTHNGVTITAGTFGYPSDNICVNPTANAVTTAPTGAANGIELDQLDPASRFGIQSYGGAAGDLSGPSGVAAFVASSNTLSGSSGGQPAFATQPSGLTSGDGFAPCTANTY